MRGTKAKFLRALARKLHDTAQGFALTQRPPRASLDGYRHRPGSYRAIYRVLKRKSYGARAAGQDPVARKTAGQSRNQAGATTPAK